MEASDLANLFAKIADDADQFDRVFEKAEEASGRRA